MPTPADELRAAAEKLRTLAAAATPGPWHPMRWHSSDCVADCDEPSCFMLIVTSARAGIVGEADVDRDSTFFVERSVHEHGEAEAAYIAAMHPGVGTALADWLDETATEVTAAEGTEYELLAHEPDNSWTAALAVARQILGSAP